MIFDTDVLIWFERGNSKACQLLKDSAPRQVSLQTCLELTQMAKNRRQVQAVKDYLHRFSFQILPIDEAIGQRALVYLEEYGISHGLDGGDALIAATAVEHSSPLATSNIRHFKAIQELELHPFKP